MREFEAAKTYVASTQGALCIELSFWESSAVGRWVARLADVGGNPIDEGRVCEVRNAPQSPATQ